MKTVPKRGDALRSAGSPLVVISGAGFNERVGRAVCWPVSMDAAQEDNPFAVPIGSRRLGLGYVMCHLPQSTDWRTDDVIGHPWKRLSPEAFKTAMFKLNEVLSGD